MRYAVFFATVVDIPSDGIFVDATYIGGESDSEQEATLLGKNLVNDRSLPGTILIKVIPLRNGLYKAQSMAIKHFNDLARDMYAAEDAKDKRKRTRAIGV
jgi:hypothetical protein